MAQANYNFIPGGSDDPLVVSLPNGADIASLWFPNPTEKVTISSPNGSGGWNELYQITSLSAELVPVDFQDFTQLQIKGDNTGGSPFWIIASDQPYSPYKVIEGGGTLTSNLRIFNVLDYGATADGITDDQDAWQRADLAAYAAGGGLLVGPGGNYLFNGGSGTLPNPYSPAISPVGIIPKGPMLLHRNVQVAGYGMNQTTILCGPNYYTGALSRPPKLAHNSPTPYAGTVFANNGYWIDYAGSPIEVGCSIRDLSICGNGHLAPGAGTICPPTASVLNGSLVELHAVQDGTIDRVNTYDSFANGCVIIGVNGSSGPYPNCNFRMSECTSNMNFPVWLSGSAWYSPTNVCPVGFGQEDNRGNWNQPGGQLPLRTVGIMNGEVTGNNIGDLNQAMAVSPFLPGNTNDALDCPTTSQVLISRNRFTLCGDGIGTNGGSDIVISYNVGTLVGSVGIAGYKSTTGSGPLRVAVIGNDLYQCGSNGTQSPFTTGTANPSIFFDAGSEDIAISTNVIVGSYFNGPSAVRLTCSNFSFVGNVLKYIGGVVSPLPTFLRIEGTKVGGTIADNVFDFGGQACTGVLLGDLTAVSARGNSFKNGTTGAVGFLLPSGNVYTNCGINGNVFDGTIPTPFSILTTYDHIVGCDFSGNPGVTGTMLNPLPTGPTTPVAASGSPFTNPFPWPCQVWMTGGTITDFSINGVDTGTSGVLGPWIRVPVAGTITPTWSPKPTWVWIAEG